MNKIDLETFMINSKPANNAPISLEALADLIRDRFTPYAFTCQCQGAEPSCAITRKRPEYIARVETVTRIAKFIETLTEGH